MKRQTPPFTVRVIYLQPAGTTPASLNIDETMKNVQKTYQSEMERHGYGKKTFRLDTDATGKVFVHQVQGKLDAGHYANDTLSVCDELGTALNMQQYVYIVMIAGIEKVLDSRVYGASNAWGNGSGGHAFIPENMIKINIEDVIKHEIGHLFGLADNYKYDRNTYSYIMGVGNRDLRVHEAHWLSKSHFFNDNHTIKEPPCLNIHPIETIPKHLLDRLPHKIRLKYEVEDPYNIHQLMVRCDNTRETIAYTYFEEVYNSKLVNFEVPRFKLAARNKLFVSIMDNFGNYKVHQHNYDLPPEMECPQ